MLSLSNYIYLEASQKMKLSYNEKVINFDLSVSLEIQVQRFITSKGINWTIGMSSIAIKQN